MQLVYALATFLLPMGGFGYAIWRAAQRAKRGVSAYTGTTADQSLSGLKSLITKNNASALHDNEAIDPRFAAHYEQHIRPEVDAFEARRVAALAVLRQRVIILIPLVAVAAILGLFFADSYALAHHLASLLGMVVIGVAAWAFWPVVSYKSSIKQRIFPNVFSFYGPQWSYRSSSIGGMDLADKSMLEGFYELKRVATVMKTGSIASSTVAANGDSMDTVAPYMMFGILPSHETAHISDRLRGDYKAVPLELIQCLLQSSSGSGKEQRTTIDYRGILIELSVPKRFSGHTTVRRDHGKVGNWFGKKFSTDLQPVRLEDPRFEKRYEVYSSDQVEARYLLTNSFMERLVELEDLMIAHSSLGTCDIQCAFRDGRLLMMLPMADEWFSTGSIFKPATFIGDINLILKQMDQLFGIIDLLQLDDRSGL